MMEHGIGGQHHECDFDDGVLPLPFYSPMPAPRPGVINYTNTPRGSWRLGLRVTRVTLTHSDRGDRRHPPEGTEGRFVSVPMGRAGHVD